MTPLAKEGWTLGLDVPIVYIDTEEGSIDAVKWDPQTETTYYRLRISKMWVEKDFFYFSTIRLLFDYQIPLKEKVGNGRIVQVERSNEGPKYTISTTINEKKLKERMREVWQ